MAAKKKKTKPVANPARGVATTSVASKPVARVEKAEDESLTAAAAAAHMPATRKGAPAADPAAPVELNETNKAGVGRDLSPEEFERQLEESELQLLVEKHATKVRRDAQRQKLRLDTDRRLLRSQAEALNTRKWLSQDLSDHVLDLIQAESRFASSALGAENTSPGKLLPEEDLTIKLWTLQLTLAAVSFSDQRIKSALKYVLDIAPNIGAPAKECIWGLEEALDWMARECSKDELPDYEGRFKTVPKSSDTSRGNLFPTGTTTSRLVEPTSALKPASMKNGSSKSRGRPHPKLMITCDSDIEPDELTPIYIDTKAKLFGIQRAKHGLRTKAPTNGALEASEQASSEPSPEEILEAKFLAKIARIESDILFDKAVADEQWRAARLDLEKEYAAAAKKQAGERNGQAQSKQMPGSPGNTVSGEAPGSDSDIAKDAEKMAAEVLEQDSDDEEALAQLFASLPVQEIDPKTGQTVNVINSASGFKVFIRDFGKWSGVSPMRALEEACRSRDAAAKITYTLVSDVAFANRHMVTVSWSKSQEMMAVPNVSHVEAEIHPQLYAFKMASVATPEVKQSEAFIATVALFSIFGSTKEEKVFMRLPATWKDLWTELSDAKKSHADAQDREVISELRSMVRQRQEQEDEDGVILRGAFRGRASNRNGNNLVDESVDRNVQQMMEPEFYQRLWADKTSTGRYQAMLRSRMQLPMWHFRAQVLEAVEQHQVVIVCGETGCGKSTQVPAYLLEHQLSQGRHCKIYCTEPRRISALSLARRVSEELGEGRNDVGSSRSLVGYSIRLESNTSKETRLVYATTGIVMRMLEGSNDLREMTHLVLDEVHERSIDSDFLLIVLKKLLLRRKDLKVVLMSATVDAEKFSAYMGGAPVLNVPGRTFPVHVQYLEDALELTGYTIDGRNPYDKMTHLDDDPAELDGDSTSATDAAKELRQYSLKTRTTLSQLDEYQIEFDLIAQLIGRIAVDPNYVNYSRAILVFLPGIADIRTLMDTLLGDPYFQQGWDVFPLHSSIATEDQERAFLVPQDGFRKIVLATNIAETGITIPDVTCVIDTGKHREMRFDERRQLSRLIDTFISRANAKQRRGRAGRVQEGLCFHMFTRHRHDQLMSDQQTPEMLRLSLQDLAIRVKMCKMGGIEDTLAGALDAPLAKNVRRAIDALIDVRALTAAEDLTPLGSQLARLPLDVFLGKLILQGTIFRCLDMAITVAAILSSKSPFSAPFGQRTQADQARKAFKRGDSDLLTIYNAYLGWKKVCLTSNYEFQYCKKNFLSTQTLSNVEDLKGQLLVSLVDSGFLQLTEDERRTLNRLRYSNRRRQFYDLPQRVNVNSENDVVTSSVIAWSFYPKLLVRENKGWRNVGNNQSISLHPSSVNKRQLDLKWLSYYHIMQSKQFLNAHETTAVDSFAIALLCGDARIDMYSGVVVLDGNRARFSVPDWKTLLLIKVLRTRLRELMTRSFKTPGKLLNPQQEKWLGAWQRIFGQDFGKA